MVDPKNFTLMKLENNLVGGCGSLAQPLRFEGTVCTEF